MLMGRLKSHQQSKFQTPVQTLSAVGRGIGPYIGTLLIAYGDGVSAGLGPRLLIAFSWGAIVSSIAIPSLFCGRFYDAPKPSPGML